MLFSNICDLFKCALAKRSLITVYFAFASNWLEYIENVLSEHQNYLQAVEVCKKRKCNVIV